MNWLLHFADFDLFRSGTPLNDYCKHSSPLHFNDDKFHLKSCFVRSYLLRLDFTLFWNYFVYLTMWSDRLHRALALDAGSNQKNPPKKTKNPTKTYLLSLPLTFALPMSLRLWFACPECFWNWVDIRIWLYCVVSRDHRLWGHIIFVQPTIFVTDHKKK